MGTTGTATCSTTTLALLAAGCLLAACQPIGTRAPDPTATRQAATPGVGSGGPFGGAAYAAAMAGPEPAPVNGIGYVVINAPIAVPSRDFFIASVDKLKAAGAREIDLGINSPGGSIDAAQDIVAYMARVHRNDGVTFKAYNLGLVASAATYIFLNAQDRYAGPRGTFLFHAAGMVASGPALINSERLRESADKLDAYERTVRATLAARTHLTPGEAQTYVRRTVLLNADDARRDGVVDAIAEMQPPKEARAYIISIRPITPPAAPAPPAAPELPR